MIFSKEHQLIIGILDFDLIRISQQIKDISLGMHKFSRMFGEKTIGRNDIGSNISIRSKQFLHSYQELAPLTAEEINVIPTMIFNESKKKILYILSKHYIKNDTSSDFDLEKQLVLMMEAKLIKGELI